MAEQLDRAKLLEQLQEQRTLAAKNTYYLNILERKITEFFSQESKHNKTLETGSSDELQEIKYEQLLRQFGRIHATEQAAKSVYDTTLQRLKDESTTTTEQCHEKMHKLAERLLAVGPTLQSGATGRFLSEKYLQRALKRMQTIQSRLSAKRRQCMHRQNITQKLALLAEQHKHLGDNLELVDFELVKAETEALDDKIRSRGKILSRLISRTDTAAQKLAHVREKDETLRYVGALKANEFRCCQVRHVELQRRLIEATERKNALQTRCKKLISASGILGYTKVMLDYDRTKEKVDLLQKQLDELNEDTDRTGEIIKLMMGDSN